jgi:CxxC motif-containing protein
MRHLICISCPRGCHLTIDDNLNVSGNKCPKGVIYARSELTNPLRIVTSTARIINRKEEMVSLKTSKAAPKNMVFDIMKEINKLKVKAPIKIGDILIKNVLGLDIDIVATKNIK